MHDSPDASQSNLPTDSQNISRPHPTTDRVPVWRRTVRPRHLLGALLFIYLVVSLWSILKPAQQWQYRIESVPDGTFMTDIDKLGSDGWEMVFARRASAEANDPLTGKPNVSYEMIFKRSVGPLGAVDAR